MNQSIIKTRSQIGQESQQEGCRVHPRKQNQIEVHKKHIWHALSKSENQVAYNIQQTKNNKTVLTSPG
jgi:hypothetical protein